MVLAILPTAMNGVLAMLFYLPGYIIKLSLETYFLAYAVGILLLAWIVTVCIVAVGRRSLHYTEGLDEPEVRQRGDKRRRVASTGSLDTRVTSKSSYYTPRAHGGDGGQSEGHHPLVTTVISYPGPAKRQLVIESDTGDIERHCDIVSKRY